MSSSTSPAPSRRRLLLLLLLLLLTSALVGLGLLLALSSSSPTQAAGSTTAPTDQPSDEPVDSELTTLALPVDDETESNDDAPADDTPADDTPADTSTDGDPDIQLPTLPADTTAPNTYWQVAPPAIVQAGAVVPIRLRAEGEIDGSLIDKTIYLDGAPIGNSPFAHRNYDFSLDTAGLTEGVHVLRGTAVDESGNEGEAITAFTIDGTGPTITVKTADPASVGGPTVYSNLSLKLFDAGQVDKVVINGVTKDLTNNNWSDVNFLTVGEFDIQSGVPFTVVAYDLVGNTSTATFTIDGVGPTITVKPEPDSLGGPNYFGKLSLKLYDAFQVDKVVINGQTKDLTNDNWSDVNFLQVGQYGIQSDVPFTVVAYDVAGNTTARTFVLDNVAPTVSWQVAPSALEQGETHWRWVVENAPDRGETFNKVMYIDGVLFDEYDSVHFNRDLHFDSSVLSDGVHTAQGWIYDEAGNVGKTSIVTFTVDNSGPTITVKTVNPASVGNGPVGFQSLSLKLFDANKVDKVVINGHTKDLTDNQWSDVNYLNVGQFGIVDSVDFVVTAYDVAGNSTSQTFRIDHTAPTLGWQNPPYAVERGSTNWLAVLIDGHLEPSGQFTWSYVVDGVPLFSDTRPNWGYNYSFDTTTVTDGTHTVYARACDEAGNCGVTDTRTFVVDNTGPTATPKSGSWSSPVWSGVSFKLHDAAGVDRLTLNGVEKDLTDNQWSDLNFVAPGQFGAVEGWNTLVVYDIYDNSSTYSFRLDTKAPTVGWQVFQPKADRPGYSDWLWVVTNEPDGLFDKRYYLVAPGQGPELIGQFVSGHFNYNFELNIADLADGTYEVYGVAYDQAGNSSRTDSRYFTVESGVWVS